MTRRDQIAAGLAAVAARIERACRRAGRDPAEVTVVVRFWILCGLFVAAGLGIFYAEWVVLL